MATATSGSCVTGAKIEITTLPVGGSPTWHRLPCVQKITKTYTDTEATKVRHSDSGDQFVTICGSSTRTPKFEVTAFYANDDPIEWYLHDGDLVRVKITKGGASPYSSFTETFDAKYVDGGRTWDNSSTDGEQYTYTFEATSTVTKAGPTGTSKIYNTFS